MQAPRERSDKSEVVEQKILTAAIACLLRFGSKRCTMEDFAKAAGMGRKTIYRYFANRQDLLDRIAFFQFQTLIAELEERLSPEMQFAEVVEEIIVKATDWIKHDAVITSLLEASNYLSLAHYLTDSNSDFAKITEQLFKPYHRRASRDQLLRPDLDNKELVGWLRSGQLLIMLKGDIAEAQQRQFVRDFLLPAVLRH